MNSRKPFILGFLLALIAFVCMAQSSRPFIIRGLPIEVSPDAANDYVPIFDASSGLQKRATVSSVAGGGSAPSFNGNQFDSDGAVTNIVDGVLITNTVLRGVSKIANGSVGSPAVIFENDTNLGLYRVGADEMAVSVASQKAFSVGGVGGNTVIDMASQLAGLDVNWEIYTNTFARLDIKNGGTVVRWSQAYTNDGSGGLNWILTTLDTSGAHADNPITIPQSTSGAIAFERPLTTDSTIDATGTITTSGGDVVLDAGDVTVTLGDVNITAGNVEAISGSLTGASVGLRTGYYTGNLAAYFNASGQIVESSTVSKTELEYLNGVTSAIQTQLDAKSAKSESETFVIMEPDVARGVSDDLVLKKFIAEKYPSGVTITSIHIDASAAYTSETFLFEHWDDASGTTQATVESIACSAISTEDDGTLSDATIPADYFLVVNFDDTPEDVAYVTITISFTY